MVTNLLFGKKSPAEILAGLLLAALGAGASSLHAQAPAEAAASAEALVDAQTARRAALPRGPVSREELWMNLMRGLGIDNPDPAPKRPTSRADSLAWVRARDAAAEATGKRIVVSLFDRELYLIDGSDTLLVSPAAIGMGEVTIHGKKYDFSTPRSVRRVLAMDTTPLWIPPDWHYAMDARAHGLELARLTRGRETHLSGGRKLVIHGDQVRLVQADGSYRDLGHADPIIFDGTEFIPPAGTQAREVPFVLGKYKLTLGDGYLIHGTLVGSSIGFPSTHGCVRLPDDNLAFLYDHVDVGTPVYIY